MNGIKKESAWTFVTSSSGSIGVEFVAAEGGKIYLQDPSGVAVDFTYGTAGAGLSYGFKLPKIGKIQIPVKGKSVTGNVAPASFPNTGCLYVMDACPGSELTKSDIQGVCMFVEVTGGLIAGGSAMAMLVGASGMWLAACAASLAMPGANVYTMSKLIDSATGLLLIAGVNVGVQAGVGVAGYVGALY